MNNQDTGKFIATRRKALGLSQKQLAEKLHLTDKAVSKWETGNSAPDISNLLPLAEVLGVSVAELLSGKEIEKEELPAQTDRAFVENMQQTAKQNRKKIVRTVIIVAIVAALLTTAVNSVWRVYWGRRHSVLYTVDTVYVYQDNTVADLYHLTYTGTVKNWKGDFTSHTYKLKNDLRAEAGGLDFTGASDYFTTTRTETPFQIAVDFQVKDNGYFFPKGTAPETQIREAIRISQFKAIDKNGNTVESAELYMADNPDARIVFLYQGEQ